MGMDNKSESPWLRHYDSGVPQHLTYPDLPLFAFLEQSASRFPLRACTLFKDQAVSYARMERLSSALAAGLAAMGLEPGGRVALILPNCPQFVLAFYAVLKAGGVVVATNPGYKAAEMAFQLADCGAKIIIALDSLAAMLTEIGAQTDARHIILTSLSDAVRLDDLPAPVESGNNSQHRLLDILARFDGSPRPDAAVNGDSPAVFQYSGGTTGTPKAAVGMQRNLAANTLQFRAWLGGLEAGREVVLAAIPLFHVYGMVIAMSLSIQAGASLVLLPNGRDIPVLLAGITRHQVTLFPGVPNLYRLINQHPDVQSQQYQLHSIKACICGSAPLLPEIKAEFERLTGGKLLEGYGLSEAPTATHCNPLHGENRSGSIGLPLPDVDCRIVSLEDGQTELPAGQAGELLLRGPQIMSGYSQQPDESAAALADGWLHSGDVARMAADGYFYLVDRKKDVIKVGGLQVWPREVEEAIATHPAVLEAGAVGVMHPIYGEMVSAWVVRRAGRQIEAEEVRDWVRQRLAEFKVPRQVVFCDALPRSSVGKLLRRELRSWHENSQDSF